MFVVYMCELVKRRTEPMQAIFNKSVYNKYMYDLVMIALLYIKRKTLDALYCSEDAWQERVNNLCEELDFWLMLE